MSVPSSSLLQENGFQFSPNKNLWHTFTVNVIYYGYIALHRSLRPEGTSGGQNLNCDICLFIFIFLIKIDAR